MSHFNAAPGAPLGPPPPGQVSNYNHPMDHQRYAQTVATIAVVFPISTICALLRLGTRAVLVKQFGWDDVCALITLLLNIGVTACNVIEIGIGLVDYDWNLRASDWEANYATPYSYINSVAGLIYYLAYGFAKLSILVFYLRLIGPYSRKLRAGVYVLIALMCLIILGFFITQLLFCHPVAKVFYPDTPGTCVSSQFVASFFFASALISAVSDLFILIPPIPIIWRLPTSGRRRAGFLLIFSLAFIVTAIAIVRTTVIGTTSTAALADFLYNYFMHVYLSIIEINLAIIVISIPALIQLYRWSRSKRIPKQLSPPPNPQDQEAAAASDPTSPVDPQSTPPRKPKRSPISQIVSALYSGLDGSRYEAEFDAVTVGTIHEKNSLGSLREGSSTDEQAGKSGAEVVHSEISPDP